MTISEVHAPTTPAPLVDPPADFTSAASPTSPPSTYLNGRGSTNPRQTMAQMIGHVGSLIATLVEAEPILLPHHDA